MVVTATQLQQTVVKSLILTEAMATLRRDVASMVLVLDTAADKECQQRKIASTEVVQTRAGGAPALERWTVDQCGRPVTYLVTLSPSPRGGADFQVSLER